MYPGLSDLLKDIFGINLSLPIQTFGFFVALSFFAAYYFFVLELKRKEKEGILQKIPQKITINKKPGTFDYIINALVGFLIGYKIFLAIIDYKGFVDNPQEAILSSQGNFWGGLLGMALALFLLYRERKKIKEPEKEIEQMVSPYQLMGSITLVAAVSGIIGAKLFHNLENINDLMADPIGSLLSFSGLTFYGGLICGAVAVLWYANKKGIKPIYMLDASGPAMMLAYAVGRIGCQLSGDGDWGIVNIAAKPDWMNFLPDWIWSFNYPHNVINEGISIPGCMGKHCFMLAQPVFPTPFYETIICLLLFAVIWMLRRRFTLPGIAFSVYLVLNGIERFFIEKIRVNTLYHVAGKSFTQAELISFLLVLSGLVGILIILRKYNSRKNNPVSIHGTEKNPN